VALAIPLYEQLGKLRVLLLPLLSALVIGSVTAIVSAVGIGMLLGASPATLLALSPKSVTAAIAMGIAEKIGARALVDRSALWS
jgi:putative effector of murein hydrolase